MNAPSPTISVVVIFRNALPTLPETLHSLAMNAGAGREFVFVDDGSTDGSDRPVKEFIAAHPYVARLITLSHPVGTAGATARGFCEATGEYVMRCDADDCLEPGALDCFAAAAASTGADIVAAPMIYDYRRGDNRRSERIARVGSLNLNDMPIDTAHFALLNKIFRRRLLTGNDFLPFEGIDRWEDLGVVARLLALRPATAIIDRPLYRYIRRGRGGTLSSTNNELILRDHIAAASQLAEWFERRGLAERYAPFLLRLKFIAKVKFLRHRPRRLRQWQTTFPEVNGSIMSLRHVALPYRLLFTIAARL